VRRLAIVALLVVFAAPAAAQKVYIDYDKDYDFKKVKTFGWAEQSETSLEKTYPLVHSRIVNSIEHHLTQGGLIETDQNPDVYVTYHTNSKEELQLNTSSYGYGYPGGWYTSPYWGGGWGMSGATTTVTSYTRGTLIIDIWDAHEKKMIWRGSMERVISDNPDKLGKQIEKALQKMVKKWQKMYKPAQQE